MDAQRTVARSAGELANIPSPFYWTLFCERPARAASVFLLIVVALSLAPTWHIVVSNNASFALCLIVASLQ
mgnify:CR=1 FL=1